MGYRLQYQQDGDGPIEARMDTLEEARAEIQIVQEWQKLNPEMNIRNIVILKEIEAVPNVELSQRRPE